MPKIKHIRTGSSAEEDQSTYSVDAGPLLGHLDEAGDDDGQTQGRGGHKLLEGEVGHTHGLSGLYSHLLHLLVHIVRAPQTNQHCTKTSNITDFTGSLLPGFMQERMKHN